MKQETYLQIINMLKACYINWNFDLNNDIMLKAWYKKLENLDDKLAIHLIEQYTDTQKYPPQSPAELISYMQELMTKKELSSTDAWQKVLDLVRQYGFTYNRETIYKKIANDPALTKTVKEFESELRNLKTDDVFLPQKFKKAYEENIKNKIYENSNILLSGGNIAIEHKEK